MYRKNIKRSIIMYLLFAFVFGGLIFRWMEPEDTFVEHDYVSNVKGDHRAAVLEEREESGIARLELIDQAEHSLDITYHTIHAGEWADLFFASVLEAADRGIEVRILFDGLLHNMRGDLRSLPHLLSSHPNITLKYYESFNPFRPWTWNNRLHDKLILVDGTFAMTGGRNIGDKYFTNDENDKSVNDRDVVLIYTGDKEDKDKSTENVVTALSDYFDSLFDHEYTTEAIYKLSKNQERKATIKNKQMTQMLRSSNHRIDGKIDWLKLSVPIDEVKVVHNPLERLNKKPVVWHELIQMFEKAEKSIVAQSPYIIPTNEMIAMVDLKKINADENIILTNSKQATPNLLAFSGYVSRRDSLMESDLALYEYIGPHSIHGKTFVFDSYISVLGSFNIDARSAFLSTETMVIIEGEEFARKVEGNIDELVDKSQLYIGNNAKDNLDVSFIKKVGIRLLQPFTTSFDYLL